MKIKLDIPNLIHRAIGMFCIILNLG